jgi:hypothetical protein
MISKKNIVFSIIAILLISGVYSTPNVYATIVATGGTITYSGDYTVHTFTTSGTFEITSGTDDVEYWLVAGGGGGSNGGGGAGQILNGTNSMTVGTFPVTIGATSSLSAKGNDSIFNGLTADGGGASGLGGGGSGGGGLYDNGLGGSATSLQTSGDWGYDGGRHETAWGFDPDGGGGGGAGEVGNTDGNGHGGDGIQTDIDGTLTYYAGGGSAGSNTSLRSGGDGGGGQGMNACTSACSGGANTGGGSGGSYSNGNGFNLGGSGILIVTYLTVNVPQPNAVDDLSYTNLTNNSLDLIWTEPELGGGIVENYMINSTSPHSSTTTFLANTTSLFYNVTGLTWGTDYSFSASVLTDGGYNFTGSVLNITTPATLYTGVAPTSLTVNDGDHSVNTILNLEWVADLMDNINGFRIFFETPIGNGFTTLTSNTTTTTLYYNDTGLIPGQYYNYKVAALNGTGISDNSTAYSQTPHKLPDSVNDLVITPNALLQFLGSWSAPTLYGTLNGYQINYTTPAGDPQTIYTSTEPTTSTTISGLNPTVEYSFRVAANTYHGINATGGNIANATASSEIAVGDLDFDAGTNPDVEPIWYENYVVDSTTNNVQVRYDSALTVDCTITERVADNVSTYTGLSETAATGYVYHNFTVTNAGNDILDWDCYDQTDALINGQYALTQDQAASGVGGFGNVPLFSLMGNFTGGLYGTEGSFAGIDLITLFIVIISMLGFNKKNPALGVGVMATLLGAAWYYELIPWTSGVLGALAVVLVLAIGQGIKRD